MEAMDRRDFRDSSNRWLGVDQYKATPALMASDCDGLRDQCGFGSFLFPGASLNLD
jgi:hypothetical protein